MNCDGLMQIVVKPRSSCAGIDASASPRSATPLGPSNRPRVPAHHLELGGVSASGRHPRAQPLEILVARRPSGLNPLPYDTSRRRSRSCIVSPPNHSAGPSGLNGLGSSQTSEKR